MAARIKGNRRGVIELMKLPAVAANLRQRGERVAAAAGEGFEVGSSMGKNRARVTVRSVTLEAHRKAAKEHTLQRALNAARG